jgi:hypothetical protein
MMALDEADQEALADLLHSPGWDILWSRVLRSLLTKEVNRTLELTRARDAEGAREALAKVDGAVLVASEAYKAAGEPCPEAYKDLRRA